LPHASERFQWQADRYARSRPDYPAQLLTSLSQLILSEPSGTDRLVADVGSGTGIFTRQLRALLPVVIPIVGIEPASDMRLTAEAMSAGIPGISYVDGLAQRLPIPSGQARAVVAATAAHWFDRADFFEEACRVLLPSGILAIVEYVRDVEGSLAAAVVVDFLARHGGPRAYEHPDYPAELRAAPGFHNFEHRTEQVVSRLSPDAFVALALSSSHARHAIETLGEKAAANVLLEMAEPLLSRHGHIPFGYIFHLFTVRRR
jgi:SAM-dependent methyltransferase